MAQDFQSKLADYIHIYMRTDEELEFESPFIQKGVVIVESTLDFILNSIGKDENGFIQATLNFNTLNEPMKAEFSDWLNRKDEDIEGLKERIRKIKSDHGTLE
jgi:hypothetical protein